MLGTHPQEYVYVLSHTHIYTHTHTHIHTSITFTHTYIHALIQTNVENPHSNVRKILKNKWVNSFDQDLLTFTMDRTWPNKYPLKRSNHPLRPLSS